MNATHDAVRLVAATALGDFTITATARGLRAIAPTTAPEEGAPPGAGDPRALAHARAAAGALLRYAVGEPASFDAPFDTPGSPLELAVWEALRAIPFGATATYGAIAAAVGRPGEAREIGQAIGANPVMILTPCHRVVGADGSLRGFAWGLDLKRRLLAHEGSGSLALFG